MHVTRAAMMEVDEKSQSGNDAKQELLEEIAGAEAKANKLQEQIAREKEIMDLAVEKAEQETELCERRIHQLRHEPTPKMSAAQGDLRQAEAEYVPHHLSPATHTAAPTVFAAVSSEIHLIL